MISSLLMSGSDVLTIINSAFFILGGIAVFMVGMSMMGSNLENAAGKSMRKLMSKATKNRFIGVGTGAAVTAVVNSSSATTVMIVGFVNVGIMTLVQAAPVIMGANIGTTVSAFIMALASEEGASLSVAAVFALIAFVGFILTLVGKKDKIKRIGYIFEGVGLIFIGLNVMSAAVHDMLENENIEKAIEGVFIAVGYGKSTLSWEIPVLFLLGALLTAAMQSSAAITSIIITLASSNLISLQMAMCIILGANVGTCFTSILSSMGASINAKRAAMVHLLFNIAGCFIFIWPVAFAGKYIASLLSSQDTRWQIALFHLVFNLLTTFILLPFVNILVKLSCLIVKDKKGKSAREENAETLDKRLLKTPAIAVGQVRKELLRMGAMAFDNYKLSLSMLLEKDLSEKEKFDETEKNINETNRYVTSFLVKLSLEELAEQDEKKVSSFYHVASDLERIGDYAENIVEYAQRMVEDNAEFSDSARAEIARMDGHLTALYENVVKTFGDITLAHMEDVEREEQTTDDICTEMQEKHLRRMTEGTCSPEAGVVYLQLALNLERIGDHMHNIANSVKQYAPQIKAATA